MSRYSFKIENTQKIKDFIATRLNGYNNFTKYICSFGYEESGYFIQIIATPGKDFDETTTFTAPLEYDGDIYAANVGFFRGVGKNRILETLEQFGITEEFRKNYSKHFESLCLDLPF